MNSQPLKFSCKVTHCSSAADAVPFRLFSGLEISEPSNVDRTHSDHVREIEFSESSSFSDFSGSNKDSNLPGTDLN